MFVFGKHNAGQQVALCNAARLVTIDVIRTPCEELTGGSQKKIVFRQKKRGRGQRQYRG